MPHADEISVVIPAYNHERYLPAALESVRDQTLPAGDVVVVDDGSTDGTAAILKSFELDRLTVLGQPNRGAHVALNRAISASRGRWIAILNSDDLFTPERLEHALGVARSGRAALLLGRVRMIDGAGHSLPSHHPAARWYAEALDRLGSTRLRDRPGTFRATSGALGSALLENNAAVTTTNFFLHRELWRRLRGFRAYRYVHDLDFLLRALELCPHHVVFEGAIEDVRYRVHERNTVTENVPRALAERARMIRRRSLPWRVVARAVGWHPGGGALARVTGKASLPPRLPLARCGVGAVRCGLVVEELDQGGLEKIVALLALTLPSSGVDTAVLCTRRGGRMANRLVEAGVPVHVAGRRPDEGRKWIEATRPDVLSAHFVGLGFLEALGAPGVPIVDTVHNTYAWLTAEGWKDEAAKHEMVSETVAVSRIAAEHYARRVSGSGSRFTVIPNGIGPSQVCALPRAYARQTLGIEADDPVFVQVGRWTLQKNQLGLVDAFRDVLRAAPRALLLLVGTAADRAYVARLRAEHAGLLARGQVRLVPFDTWVDHALSAADVFVANSYFEGWSVAASEALWAGLPLVLSECGGSRELVGAAGERGRLVPNAAGDPIELSPRVLEHPDPAGIERNREALVRAMLETLRLGGGTDGRNGVPDPESMRAEARAFAREQLTAAKMARRHAEVLRRVAAGGTSAGATAMDSVAASSVPGH